MTFQLQSGSLIPKWMHYSPFIINGLNDESKSRADTVHIFIHDPLDDRGFASVIKSTML